MGIRISILFTVLFRINAESEFILTVGIRAAVTSALMFVIAKTEPTKLEFRAQSKFKFQILPFHVDQLFFFTSRVKLVYVRLDKFAKF